jgi:hypothetical protein
VIVTIEIIHWQMATLEHCFNKNGLGCASIRFSQNSLLRLTLQCTPVTPQFGFFFLGFSVM